MQVRGELECKSGCSILDDLEKFDEVSRDAHIESHRQVC